MKDVGKLDLSRVQEGRGILATTLNTRGLSNEQRIQAAISIMDTEKGFYHNNLHQVKSRVVYHQISLLKCVNDILSFKQFFFARRFLEPSVITLFILK